MAAPWSAKTSSFFLSLNLKNHVESRCLSTKEIFGLLWIHFFQLFSTVHKGNSCTTWFIPLKRMWLLHIFLPSFRHFNLYILCMLLFLTVRILHGIHKKSAHQSPPQYLWHACQRRHSERPVGDQGSIWQYSPHSGQYSVGCDVVGGGGGFELLW